MKASGKVKSKKGAEREENYQRMKFLSQRIISLSQDIGRIKQELALLYYIHKEELKDIPSIIEKMNQEVEEIESQIELENAIKDAVSQNAEEILEKIQSNEPVEIITDNIKLNVTNETKEQEEEIKS